MSIFIWKDESIGSYVIEIDGKIVYEHLAANEVVEIVRELTEGRA